MLMSVPLPERVTDCGLLEALSLMVMAPARPPVAVGVKLTVTVQGLGGAGVAVQVSETLAKSPETVMPVKLSVALPAFVIVTLCVALVLPRSWLPNASCVADKVTDAPEGVPAPVRTIDCGLSPALSWSVKEPT